MGWFLGFVVAAFTLSILRGAPWLPTRSRDAKRALELLDLKPGQTLVDLGCGSGELLLAAARAELQTVGYEINPLLWLVAYVRTRPYHQRVKVVLGDYWLRPLPPCDGVYVFLIDHFMAKLERKLVRELVPGNKVVSYIFTLPLQAAVAEDKGLYLYKF
ncbi:MAG: hypothetical protein WD467_00795 [Candidatus Saccharimonadales bacterium]